MYYLIRYEFSSIEENIAERILKHQNGLDFEFIESGSVLTSNKKS